MVFPSDSAYQIIGQSIVDSIGVNWHSASITTSIKDKDVLSVDALFIDKEDREHIFTVSDVALKEFYHIYMQMVQSPKGIWKKMIYKMTPDGQFEISFEY